MYPNLFVVPDNFFEEMHKTMRRFLAEKHSKTFWPHGLFFFHRNVENKLVNFAINSTFDYCLTAL